MGGECTGGKGKIEKNGEENTENNFKDENEIDAKGMEGEEDDDLYHIEKNIVLLLGSVERPIPSATHLEKEMFIFSNFNPSLKELFRFEKYRYGPYSQALQESLEDPFYFDDAYTMDRIGIHLTQKGGGVFSQINQEEKELKEFRINMNAMRLIREIYDRLSVNEFLFLIYITYPEYMALSEVSDKLLKKRKILADNLAKKHIITKSRYLELIGDINK